MVCLVVHMALIIVFNISIVSDLGSSVFSVLKWLAITILLFF